MDAARVVDLDFQDLVRVAVEELAQAAGGVEVEAGDLGEEAGGDGQGVAAPGVACPG